MKRSNPTGGKKTHIPSDFKRLKAKVGKRAPQKLNATETDFRTASVQVRNQTITNQKSKKDNNNSNDGTNNQNSHEFNLELISSRGKTLRDLSSQLHHHSPNARISALQGIKDTLTHANSIQAIQANLSVLIPSLSKCFVDDDSKVRSHATSMMFNELIPRITSSSSGTAASKPGQFMSLSSIAMVQPFLPLMMAYLTSALHSLDSDIRYDGCLTLELLCIRCKGLFQDKEKQQQKEIGKSTSSGKGRQADYLDGIVPAFGKLLNDVSGGLASLSQRGGNGGISPVKGGNSKSTSSKNNKKRNKAKDGNRKDTHRSNDGQGGGSDDKKTSKNTTRVMNVLRSLISVLRIVASSTLSHSNMNEDTIGLDGGSSEESSIMTDNHNVHNGPSLLPSLVPADLNFLSGGRTSNAIVIWNNSYMTQNNRHTAVSLKGLHDLSRYSSNSVTSSSDDHSSCKNKGRKLKGSNISLGTQRDLLSKLRDRFVEVSQRGHDHGGNGLFLSLGSLEELALVVASLRLVWNGFCRFEMSHIPNLRDLNGETQTIEWKKLRSVGLLLQSLLVRSLPVRDDSGNPMNTQKYDLLNASICCAISEFGSTLVSSPSSAPTATEEQSNTWVDTVFSYLLPRLETEISLLKDDVQDNGAKDEEGMEITRSNARVTLLKVIGQLLLRNNSSSNQQHLGNCLLEDHGQRMELLKKYGDVFFSPDMKTSTIVAIYKSGEGRRAAILLTTLITQHFLMRKQLIEENEHDGEWTEMWEQLAKMATILPNYLKAWRNNFPKLSCVVLSTMLSITRQYNMNSQDILSDSGDDKPQFDEVLNRFCDSLRSTMKDLFMASYTHKHKIGNRVYISKISIFEQLPETGQRLMLGIVGMLKNPPEILVQKLSEICARVSSDHIENNANLLSDEMADYIMGVLHSIRHTIPLQHYLTCIITSTGINRVKYKKKENDKRNTNEEDTPSKLESKSTSTPSTETRKIVESFDIEFVTSYDNAIARSCRYLTQCGGSKVLEMLSPLISSWLSYGESQNSNGDIDQNDLMIMLLKVRCSLCILSCFELNDAERDNNGKFDKQLLRTVCSLLLSMPLARVINTDRELRNTFMIILSPLISLLSSKTSILDGVIKECCVRVQNKKYSIETKESLITSLLVLVKNQDLQTTLRSEQLSNTLKETSIAIDGCLSNGPLDMLGLGFKTEVNALLGLSFA